MLKITSDDNLLLDNLLNNIAVIASKEAHDISLKMSRQNTRIKGLEFDYPFDQKIIQKIKDIFPLKNNDSLYMKIEELKDLWFILVDKAIKCLRYFDSREPYLKLNKKKPQSYGIEELKLYYEEFAGFEALLYGSNQFYRDHVIHLFRTWLIGMNILISKPKNEYLYKSFQIEGELKDIVNFNFFECISIWTIASLCHDLGYPLEKFHGVINRTQKMMEYLVSQPKIQQDITFSGTQDKLNEFIVRLISSRMKKVKNGIDKNTYFARTQSKYYMKYSKSLEDYKHGIISAIIIYKVLLYFLESDFSIHEDYQFKHEEAKQFYLRRDILRSIASHTCKDVYHIYSNTFPLLLIICDELQVWGRKRWTDFYKKKEMLKTNFTLVNYDQNNITVEYVFNEVTSNEMPDLLESFFKQYQKFKKLFRDGQDTADRIFSFYVRYNLKLSSRKDINVTMLIPDKDPAIFKLAGKNYKRKQDFKKAVNYIYKIRDVKEIDDFSVSVS